MKISALVLGWICVIIAFTVLYKLYKRFEKAYGQENIADMLRYMLYILVWWIVFWG